MMAVTVLCVCVFVCQDGICRISGESREFCQGQMGFCRVVHWLYTL